MCWSCLVGCSMLFLQAKCSCFCPCFGVAYVNSRNFHAMMGPVKSYNHQTSKLQNPIIYIHWNMKRLYKQQNQHIQNIPKHFPTWECILMFCLLFSICWRLGRVPGSPTTNDTNQTHERQHCDRPWISGALSHASNVWPACFRLPCWQLLSYTLFTKSLTSLHLQRIHQSASTGRNGNAVLESGLYAASQDKIWLK